MIAPILLISLVAPVQWLGEQRQVMRDGDTRARIDLRTLAGRPHLYALGPLAGLRGEVTIGSSEPSISTVTPIGGVAVDNSFAHSATFLVYAEVPVWTASPLPASVQTLADLGRHLEDAARAAGLPSNQPFAFRLTGRAPRILYHIVNKQDDSPHSAAVHKKIQVLYTLTNAEVEMIGFWSDQHHGIFTHHGENIHVHVRTRDRRHAGHVDEATLGPDLTLHLPANDR